MRKLFHQLSYQYQILLGCICVAMIPLVITLFLINQIYSVAWQHEAGREGDLQIQEMDDSFSRFLESVHNVCAKLCEKDLTASMLLDKVNDEYQKELYLTLYRESNNIPQGMKIEIYDAAGYLRFATDKKNCVSRLPLYWGILGQAKEDKENLFHTTGNIPYGRDNIVFQTAYTVESEAGTRMGYIVMELTQEDMDAVLAGSCHSGDTVYLLDQYENIVYSSAGQGEKRIVRNTLFTESNRSTKSLIKETEQGYHIALVKKDVSYERIAPTIFKISLLVAIICSMLCILVSAYLGKQLTKPISDLNKAMDKVKKGDLTIQVRHELKNELGALTDNFNHMTTELDDHVKKLVNRQKEINRIQLQLFQTQLNPHFLYNTLDSIKWEARIHELSDVSHMAENLAYILQKSIRSEPFIPLREELEIVKEYMEIQQIRFGGKFVYEEDIPDELLDCIVPKLMLQPLVENAVIHGLAEQEEGQISVYAERLSDMMKIYVTDDGAGMDEETVKRLNQDMPRESAGHVGLYNVSHIIKLYFGEQYGVTVSVEEEIGTTVMITLPMKMGD